MAHISSWTPTFTHPSTFSPTQYTQHMLISRNEAHFSVYKDTQLFTHSCLHTPTVYVLRLTWRCPPIPPVNPHIPAADCVLLASFFPPPRGQKLCASLLAISLLPVTQSDSQRVFACPLSYSWAWWWDLHLQTKVLTWNNVIWTSAQCCFTNQTVLTTKVDTIAKLVKTDTCLHTNTHTHTHTLQMFTSK